MKAIIEYDLEDDMDSYSYRAALKAKNAIMLLLDIDSELRHIIRYQYDNAYSYSGSNLNDVVDLSNLIRSHIAEEFDLDEF